MSSPRIDPSFRLRNLKRQLRDLLMGRRLSADPESGVVELSDFGVRCDQLADFAAESHTGLAGSSIKWVMEEIELAARLAARMETLLRSKERIETQCGVLEEAARLVEAAIAADAALDETPAHTSLAAVAGRERDLFAPFVGFEGSIEAAPAGEVDRGRARRALRRALLEHPGGPFRLDVSRDGVLRFSEFEFRTEATAADEAAVPRSAHEPPETKKALDLRESTGDPALRDFLLAKAVDEAVFAYLAPRLAAPATVERARALPRRPGKRFVVRPEAVARPVAGWDAAEAARCVEKVASRRLGPEWARVPKAAYPLRLFFGDDDALAADLLALGPALRRMERGEEVEGTAPTAAQALRGLLALLG